MTRARAAALLCLSGLLCGFAAPWQPFDAGPLHMLRPLIVHPRFDDAPLNALMTKGWRLAWEGEPGPGRIVVRFVVPVVPADPARRTQKLVLQVGESRNPSVVASCLNAGLVGPNGRGLPDRAINGVAYAAAENGDAGMSQGIAALDLRAVVGGRCYAVERFGVWESASDGDPAVTLPQAQGEAEVDRMLASLTIAP